MTKVTLNSGSASLEISLFDLHELIHGLNLASVFMYHRSGEYTPGEQDRLRDLRAQLIDFYDDITPVDLPF